MSPAANQQSRRRLLHRPVRGCARPASAKHWRPRGRLTVQHSHSDRPVEGNLERAQSDHLSLKLLSLVCPDVVHTRETARHRRRPVGLVRHSRNRRPLRAQPRSRRSRWRRPRILLPPPRIPRPSLTSATRPHRSPRLLSLSLCLSLSPSVSPSLSRYLRVCLWLHLRSRAVSALLAEATRSSTAAVGIVEFLQLYSYIYH